jgi:hypothetical protein
MTGYFLIVERICYVAITAQTWTVVHEYDRQDPDTAPTLSLGIFSCTIP